MKKIIDVKCCTTDTDGVTRGIENKKMVTEIICNKCEKQLWESPKGESPSDLPGWLEVSQSWSYNSCWDMEHHEFHLCIQCYSQLIDSFKVKVAPEKFYTV